MSEVRRKEITLLFANKCQLSWEQISLKFIIFIKFRKLASKYDNSWWREKESNAPYNSICSTDVLELDADTFSSDMYS